jgi:hypothetical protein
VMVPFFLDNHNVRDLCALLSRTPLQAWSNFAASSFVNARSVALPCSGHGDGSDKRNLFKTVSERSLR